MSEYEKVHFDKWQDLAKAVIDGGEFYYGKDHEKITIQNGDCNFYLNDDVMQNLYTKKEQTLAELIAIKPRLCWVWDSQDNMEREVALIKSVDVDGKRRYDCIGFMSWDNAQMLTDDEIKQFLSGE